MGDPETVATADQGASAVPPASPTETAAPEQAPASPEEIAQRYAPKAEAPEAAKPAAGPSPAGEKRETEQPKDVPGAEAKPAEPQTKPTASAEQAEAERALPENFRQAFQLAPELRGSYFIAKEIKQLFGTMENAKHVHGEWEAVQQTDQLLFSEDSEDQKQFLIRFAEDYPEQYHRIGTLLVEATDRQRAEQLRQQGRGDLADALEEISGLYHGKGREDTPKAATAEQRELEDLRAERAAYRMERMAEARQRAASFIQSTRGAWEKKVDTHISDRLKELAPAGLKESDEEYLRIKVHQAVQKAMDGDRIFRSRFLSLIKSGDQSDSHREKLTAAQWNQFSSLVDETLAEVMGKIAPAVVERGKAEEATEAARAARGKVPGGGRGVPTRAAQMSVADMKPKEGESYDQFTERMAKRIEQEAGA